MTSPDPEFCPACGAAAVQEHAPRREKIDSPRLYPKPSFLPGVRLLGCADCRHVFVDLRSCPDTESGGASDDPAGQDWAFSDRRAHVRLVLTEMRQFVGAGRLRILDFGCGFGAVAGALRDLGHEAVGYDPAERRVGYARSNYGVEAYSGPWDRAARSIGTVDAVYCQNVFEHVSDPLGVLTDLLPCLRPRGVLHVAVPNFESDQVGYDLPHHVQYYCPESLTRLVERAGLAVRSCRSGRPLIDRFYRWTGLLPPLAWVHAADAISRRIGWDGWTIRVYATRG
jgi:SAM-dependent methyltransferase